MSPLGPLRALLKSLSGGGEPRHLAAGFALGACWGLVPKGNLLSPLFWLAFCLFRVEKGPALASAALFSAVAYALDPAAHALGFALLTSAALKPLWTWAYNLPLVPWTRFNNTVVLGNLLLGLALFAPLYALGLRGATAYQAFLKERVARWRLVQALTGLRWVRMYMEWTR